MQPPEPAEVQAGLCLCLEGSCTGQLGGVQLLRACMPRLQDDPDLAQRLAQRLAEGSDLGKKKKRRQEHGCTAYKGLARSVVMYGMQPSNYEHSAEGNLTCYVAVGAHAPATSGSVDRERGRETSASRLCRMLLSASHASSACSTHPLRAGTPAGSLK